ncbi:Phosphorelay intermediate protein [Microbotryomycetes sp. JL221]|nr:Phosphorelay intermediate protein [Microbotryomycetes sp. JL221]
MATTASRFDKATTASQATSSGTTTSSSRDRMTANNALASSTTTSDNANVADATHSTATTDTTDTLTQVDDATAAAAAIAAGTTTAHTQDPGASSGQIVDMEVFEQLLEIDDDESHEFSKTLAFDYISQAESTFKEIEEALEAKDLDTLSRKGHFLKGSSAALGLQRVQRTCEQMQHVGQRKDESGESSTLLSEDEALSRCRGLLERVKREQDEAKDWLEAFFKA